ncbi:hypothetical protein THAOC_35344 [Thalassiosira oceanica]|uniref:MYND-type domain-containing protein n=1 Tax=Thalassiosira oceanica TaxID=159749 RepID=K0RAD2_THAOC|nr:hypothetical protein THAOC_35344 [Thalassiosira oceanica]|eukprot:EJK46011.1 hypothetical protein THAOC_35344 [Thalassiosira oceanica]
MMFCVSHALYATTGAQPGARVAGTRRSAGTTEDWDELDEDSYLSYPRVNCSRTFVLAQAAGRATSRDLVSVRERRRPRRSGGRRPVLGADIASSSSKETGDKKNELGLEALSAEDLRIASRSLLRLKARLDLGCRLVRTPTSMMKCNPVADNGIEACANCGKEGSITVKLRNCTACRLVKYCGVDCQRAHRKQHKKACKQRAAELKDEKLYSQGHERPEGDFCPICTLPIAFPMAEHSVIEWCCMKRICEGCNYAAQKRGMHDCAFCRTPCPDNDADRLAMIMTRVRKKDPEAMNHLGDKYFYGRLGLQNDMRKAVEMYTEAAELVQQDEAKAVEFFTKAAVKGHSESRHNLGCYEEEKGNDDRALKHYLISAKMGDNDSIENIKQMFMAGFATKEQYAEASKGYQDAVEEMKSHDRDEAERLGS